MSYRNTSPSLGDLAHLRKSLLLNSGNLLTPNSPSAASQLYGIAVAILLLLQFWEAEDLAVSQDRVSQHNVLSVTVAYSNWPTATRLAWTNLLVLLQGAGTPPCARSGTYPPSVVNSGPEIKL